MPRVPERPSGGQQTTRGARPAAAAPPRLSVVDGLSPVIKPYADALSLDRDKVDLIKRTICPPNTTDDELALFLHECKRRDVHPMDRLVVMTKRNDRHSPGQQRVVFMTTIDYKRSRAEETGEYAGSEEATFGPDLKTTGNFVYPTWAEAVVYRVVKGHLCKFTARVYWSEYYPGDGDVSFMWRKMPRNQLGKCAESKALNKGFPLKLGGLYVEAELDRDAVLPPAEEGEPLQTSAQPALAARPLPRATNTVFVAEPEPEHAAEHFAQAFAITGVMRGREPQTKAPMWQIDVATDDGGTDTYYTLDPEVAAAAELCFKQQRDVILETEARGTYDAVVNVTAAS